ncbi:MAG: UDP-2,3-diacylglucosamine diphosphatase [Pseudomonadota bacterium]|jgi:UDP-2,3-diacylglucosamine pyrophosphatase LpxH|nr:UDP-2,3-diacylglucosamine diphosphatase [Pseudomonadota bacterium]
MGTVYPVKPLKFRAVWISDVHLGSRACKADFLLDFLHSVQTEHLYLVGDIIDIHAMQRSVYWPQNHNNVIRSILGKAKHDTRVVYIPGNHDELVRPHTGQIFGNLDIQRTAIHETLQGKRLLILHGDEFDGMLKCPMLMNWIGCASYGLLLWMNNIHSTILRKLGKPYWSLSSFVKGKFDNANKHIKAFENAVSSYAKKRQLDGVICGHIHLPAMKEVHDVLYCNDGDWVEHCSALVERLDGTLSLIHWTDQQYVYGEQDITLEDIGGLSEVGTAANS